MKPHILVVDDEKSMQDLLRDTLKLAGFEVSLAGNDAEFRELAFHHRPDVIILDILLGDKDGIQAYDELIHDGLDSKIPVIFLSALAKGREPTYPEPGKRYALLGKPFNSDDLVGRIHKLVDNLS